MAQLAAIAKILVCFVHGPQPVFEREIRHLKPIGIEKGRKQRTSLA